MNALKPVSHEDDIMPAWRGTPVADLLRYHNLGAPFDEYHSAALLIGMCMDNRKMLRVPDNFAFILRTGGANMGRMAFKVSFAVAVGGVRAICLIGHSSCGMVDLATKRQAFVDGLVTNGGWSAAEAGRHFDQHKSEFDIPNAAAFVHAEAQRLQELYPAVTVAPLYYTVEDGLLHQVCDGA